MGYKIDLTGAKVSEGSSNFAPLEAGTYNVTIYEAEIGAYGDKSNNAGRPFLKVQFRIADGEAGANRRLFENIPLFTQWAPTAKNPDGSDAFAFFGFFSALLGKSEKAYRDEVREAIAAGGFEFPFDLPNGVLGKPLALVLGIENDDYAFNKAVAGGDTDAKAEDFKRNVVKGYRIKSEKSSAPAPKTFTL